MTRRGAAPRPGFGSPHCAPQHNTDFFLLQETTKKRTRRTIKAQRAIVGAPIDLIKAWRKMRPEARAAQRIDDAKKAKAQNQAAKAQRKADKAKLAVTGGKIQSKQGSKGVHARPMPTSR